MPSFFIRKRWRRGRAQPWAYGLFLLLSPLPVVAELAWEPSWEVYVNGQHFSIASFSSPLPPVSVARELARADNSYERYLVTTGRILLSGLSDGQHRVADIQTAAGGSRGYVSVLFLQPNQTAEHVRDTLSGTAIENPDHSFRFPSSISIDVVEGSRLNTAKAQVTQDDVASLFLSAESGPEMGVLVSLPEQ